MVCSLRYLARRQAQRLGGRILVHLRLDREGEGDTELGGKPVEDVAHDLGGKAIEDVGVELSRIRQRGGRAGKAQERADESRLELPRGRHAIVHEGISDGGENELLGLRAVAAVQAVRQRVQVIELTEGGMVGGAASAHGLVHPFSGEDGGDGRR